jgi:hypothetical protein
VGNRELSEVESDDEDDEEEDDGVESEEPDNELLELSSSLRSALFKCGFKSLL